MEILLYHIEPNLILEIKGNNTNSTIQLPFVQALELGESPYQIKEGCSYEYKFSSPEYGLSKKNAVVTVSKFDKNKGTINTNIFVGSLGLDIIKVSEPDQIVDTVFIEVLATKLGDDYEPKLDKLYRANYKMMLEDIAKKCSELLMQINSPVSQNFEPDFENESETIYQRFAFVKSLVASNEFCDAVNKILYSPATMWCETEEIVDIRRTKRFTNSAIKQILKGTNRIECNISEEVQSVPLKISNTRKIETYDTPENRFIKFALEHFAKFCEDCENRFTKLKGYFKAESEARIVVTTLRNYLDSPFFKEISRPTTLKLNSPLLQRKSGYREVLNAWMLFDLAAKLVWKGGEKVYKAGKRDIAVLYEYWLFFQLYDLFTKKFDFSQITYNKSEIESLVGSEDIRHLVEQTKDGLGLKLKSGIETSLLGKTISETRKLNVRFSYNRTYSGDTKYKDINGRWFVGQGSWTKPLRPDYTLSVWPATISEDDAELEDLIVHIHFDAKYKVDQFQIKYKVKEDFEDDGVTIDSLEKEKEEERKGIYKNADLLKMHAYKDAIRRTGGAYVLYPGTETSNEQPKGFHEIIPGLGAFAIRPSADNSGIFELSKFIDYVIVHLQDRASQREKLSSKVHDIHKYRKKEYNEDGRGDIFSDPIPEYYDLGKKVKLIPDETYILIGYAKSDKHINWIIKEQLYNTRTGKNKGSVRLNADKAGAKYLLIHKKNETKTGRLFKLGPKGPRIFSKDELLELDYPDPNNDFYLIYDIEKTIEKEFDNMRWDITKLKEYKRGRSSALPFTASLTELMGAII